MSICCQLRHMTTIFERPEPNFIYDGRTDSISRSFELFEDQSIRTHVIVYWVARASLLMTSTKRFRDYISKETPKLMRLLCDREAGKSQSSVQLKIQIDASALLRASHTIYGYQIDCNRLKVSQKLKKSTCTDCLLVHDLRI